MSLPSLIFLVAWLIALACTFIPALPATLIILVGAVAATLSNGYQPAQDLPIIITFAVITALVMLVDNIAASWGARKYGGSTQAMWGALIGGVVGLFIPILPPLNIILGPLLGAFLAELLLARKPMNEALTATWGTLVGILSGMAAKLVLHVLMGIYGLWRFWGMS